MKLELNLELKLKLVGGGWTKAKLMLITTQFEVVV